MELFATVLFIAAAVAESASFPIIAAATWQ
jgi:hypothetical protein